MQAGSMTQQSKVNLGRLLLPVIGGSIPILVALAGFWHWTSQTVTRHSEQIIANKERIDIHEQFVNSGPRFTTSDGENLENRLSNLSLERSDSVRRELLSEIKTVRSEITGVKDQLDFIIETLTRE
jgi:hypothetical protein